MQELLNLKAAGTYSDHSALKGILHHHDPRPTLPLYKAGKGFKTKLLYRIQQIIYLYE
jgi:hypothetical protein